MCFCEHYLMGHKEIADVGDELSHFIMHVSMYSHFE